MKGTVTRLPKFVRLVPSAALATPSAIVVVAVIGSRSAALADAGDGAFVEPVSLHRTVTSTSAARQ